MSVKVLALTNCATGPVSPLAGLGWQLAVKGLDGAALRQAVQATLAEMEKGGRAGGLRYDVDVDPQSLL